MTASIAAAKTRQIRPWIAALLTIFGWGLGFYYARRPRAALFWAIANIVFGVLLGVLVIGYALIVDPQLFVWLEPHQITLSIVGLAMMIPVAFVAWVTAAREKTVERSGPGRLFGYFLIIVVPILVSWSLAMALRILVVQPFHNPSGSMQPAVPLGSYFVVNKRSYGYSRYSAAPFEALLPPGRVFAQLPRRGDIVVFRPVPESGRDFVKRIVGLPGDRVQMIGGVLNINGVPVRYEPLGFVEIDDADGTRERVQAYRETLPGGANYTVLDRREHGELDDTREFVVGAGEYFVLGDDRDNSADSRVASVVGEVPLDNIVGRVDFVVHTEAQAQ